jgi:hypothetical protein
MAYDLQLFVREIKRYFEPVEKTALTDDTVAVAGQFSKTDSCRDTAPTYMQDNVVDVEILCSSGYADKFGRVSSFHIDAKNTRHIPVKYVHVRTGIYKHIVSHRLPIQFNPNWDDWP